MSASKGKVRGAPSAAILQRQRALTRHAQVLTVDRVLREANVDSLEQVEKLNLWAAELTDVQVLARLPRAVVLSLSVNHIDTLRPFAACPLLGELYLRKNRIADLAEVGYLQDLPLRILWLCDNPCAAHEHYRHLTIRLLPQVQILDNAGERAPRCHMVTLLNALCTVVSDADRAAAAALDGSDVLVIQQRARALRIEAQQVRAGASEDVLPRDSAAERAEGKADSEAAEEVRHNHCIACPHRAHALLLAMAARQRQQRSASACA